MKSKICFLAGVVLLLAVTNINAQVATAAPANVKGTPYLNEAYADGVIIFANNKRTAPVRYNAYKDLIEYKQDGIARVLDPSTTIKKVQLDKTTFVVEKYESDGKPMFGYFELLDSGKVKLYSKKVVKYLPPMKGRALDGSDQPAEFKRSADVFYYKVGDGILQEVRNIKTMIAGFPDKQEELSQFAKKEKISPRNEEELIELVRYYNSI
jgi:hypothetical protein